MWLRQLKDLAQEDYDAALEVAEFPRVVKGYGDTHLNGRRKFDLLISSLPFLRGRKDAASVLRSSIESALADETVVKLNDALNAILHAKPIAAAEIVVVQGRVSQPPAAN